MYTVEILPSAWNQLAHLTLEAYRRIRVELDAVAAALSAGEAQGGSGPVKGGERPAASSSLVVDDAIVLYDVDHEQRRVLLVEVARRLPKDL